MSIVDEIQASIKEAQIRQQLENGEQILKSKIEEITFKTFVSPAECAGLVVDTIEMTSTKAFIKFKNGKMLVLEAEADRYEPLPEMLINPHMDYAEMKRRGLLTEDHLDELSPIAREVVNLRMRQDLEKLEDAARRLREQINDQPGNANTESTGKTGTTD